MDLGITAYGLRLAIHVESASLRDLALDHLPPGWNFDSPEGAGRAYIITPDSLHADGDLLCSSNQIEYLLRRFEADVQLWLAEMCEELVFVHAGVIGWQGRAMVIPGKSFSGKTQLTRALVQAGAEYYSDEYAVFDRDGLVHTYPRPLGVRNAADGSRRRVNVIELNGAAGSVRLPVGLVISTQYEARAAWKPQPISAGRMALTLFANAVAARRKPDFVLTTLRKAVAGAVGLEGLRGEAEDVCTELLRELSYSQTETRRKACLQNHGRTI